MSSSLPLLLLLLLLLIESPPLSPLVAVSAGAVAAFAFPRVCDLVSRTNGGV